MLVEIGARKEWEFMETFVEILRQFLASQGEVLTESKNKGSRA